MSFNRRIRWACWFTGGMVVLWSTAAIAQTWSTQPADQPNMVYQVYAQSAQQWIDVAQKYALSLFKILASIDFAWMGIMLLLEGQDLQVWVARVIKKFMTIGFFYALLLNGQKWMGEIINSFMKIGLEASGNTSLTPAQILGKGAEVAGTLAAWSLKTAIIPSVGGVIALFGLLISLLILLSFVVVVLNLIITTIESFVVMGAGFIFLGFGGSRWTSPYVERYIAVAMSVGVRLMVLYMIVGLGLNFGNQWKTILSSLPDPTNPLGAIAAGGLGDAILNVLGVLCGALTYAGVAVMCPKMVASIMSGSLSMSAGDAIGMGTGAAIGAATVGAAVVTGGSSLAASGGAAAATAGGGAASGGAGTLSAGTASSAGVLAGSSPVMTTEMSGPLAVSPPSSGGGSNGSGAAHSTSMALGNAVPPPSTSIADNIRTVRDEASTVENQFPDAGGHHPPPQIKMDHGDE